MQNSSQLTELLEKTEILKKEPRLDHWLARILITELIWGKKSLQSEAKPVLTIRNYENQLRDALKNTSNDKIEKSIKKGKTFFHTLLKKNYYFFRDRELAININ